jgi:putative redox protein
VISRDREAVFARQRPLLPVLRNLFSNIPLTRRRQCGRTGPDAGDAPKESSVECSVKWIEGGMSFVAETGSGHAFVMDGAPEAGGRNIGPRPMETVLAGTGACAAFDVVLILRKGRHAVTGCEVKLSAERADSDPKVFTRIHLHFIVRGRDLKPAVVERAISLSHDKYCSASVMLARTASITHDYEIIESA